MTFRRTISVLLTLLALGDGLYIGAGKDKDPGSFFSGLIDDVRLYDRAIVP